MRRHQFKWLLVFFGFGCFSLSAQTQKYDTLPNLPEHYLTRMKTFISEPIALGKIMMVGNSITEGGNWRKLLNDSTIINRGISGDVTFGVLNRVDDIVKRKPSKLFLLIGINDLSRKTPEEVVIENIFNIIAKIHAGSPKTQIFVQSILPLNESFKQFPKNFRENGNHIITINGQIAKYAEKFNYTYVDIYSKFLDKDGNMGSNYSTDGLHLNLLGYQHWAGILKEYIAK